MIYDTTPDAPPWRWTLAVVSLVSLTNAQEYGLMCNSDWECENGFCLFKNGKSVCQPCLDCAELFFRKKGRSICAKTAHECGACRDGFRERELAAGEVADKCIVHHEEPADDSDVVMLVPVVTVASIILCAALAFGGVGLWWRRRKRASRRHSSSDAEENETSFLANESQDSITPPPSYEVSQGHVGLGRHQRAQTSSDQIIGANGVTATSSMSVRYGEERRQKTEATPFNYGGYQAQLSNFNHGDNRVEEGEFEAVEATFVLEIPEMRPLSPTGSVNSSTTEPSSWNPGGTGEPTSELDRIEEIPEGEEDDEVNPPSRQEETLRKTREAEEEVNEGELSAPRSRLDSGALSLATTGLLLTSANASSVSSMGGDSAINLAVSSHNNDTVRSMDEALGADSSTVQLTDLVRSYSSVDVRNQLPRKRTARNSQGGESAKRRLVNNPLSLNEYSSESD